MEVWNSTWCHFVIIRCWLKVSPSLFGSLVDIIWLMGVNSGSMVGQGVDCYESWSCCQVVESQHRSIKIIKRYKKIGAFGRWWHHKKEMYSISSASVCFEDFYTTKPAIVWHTTHHWHPNPTLNWGRKFERDGFASNDRWQYWCLRWAWMQGLDRRDMSGVSLAGWFFVDLCVYAANYITGKLLFFVVACCLTIFYGNSWTAICQWLPCLKFSGCLFPSATRPRQGASVDALTNSSVEASGFLMRQCRGNHNLESESFVETMRTCRQMILLLTCQDAVPTAVLDGKAKASLAWNLSIYPQAFEMDD